MPTDDRKQLTKYLTDAHSIEEQALQQLRKAPELAGDPQFAEALRVHHAETEEHERKIRRLLEERDASPSGTKDAAMRGGGEGFVLFARSQADTPGKLAAHTLSYEALEWASYALLALTAERLGEPKIGETARSIRDEERAMMERVEGLFDRTVAASLAEIEDDDVQDSLVSYLSDAHAIEAQSITLLRSGRKQVDTSTLADVFEQHLEQSRAQQERIERRLDDHGASRSVLKDAAMKLGAFNWGMFFQAHPDTDGKLAAFAYAFEHLEIGGYEQLRRVAERAGDAETGQVAESILAEERNAAGDIAATFESTVESVLPTPAR